MTTSLYAPDTKVEIAFNAGYSTASASRTWTDVSAYVELAEGLSISHGRQDEFATADANRLSLTLDNSDGRFTADRAASPYYPNVKIGRPIRVTSTPVGGAASVRFVGYVDEWPVSWEGTDNYAKAQITASSRIARLGFDAELKSMLDEETLQGTPPYAFYRLDEAAGAAEAVDYMGNAATATIAGTAGTLTFGATLAGGSTGVTFGDATGSGDKYLTAPLNTTLSANDAGGVRLEAVALTSGVGDPTLATIKYGGGSLARLDLAVGNGGATATLQDYSGGTVIFCGAVGPNPEHALAHIYYSGGTTTLDVYIDGVLAATTSTAAYGAGAIAFNHLNISGPYPSTSAVIGSVAINGDLSTMADRGAAETDGFTETAAARIIRLAGYAGVPSGEITTDSDTQLVDPIDTNGKTAIAAMRAVEATEGGVLFDGRDNTLTFHSRSHRYNTASAFTLSAASHQIETDIAPKLDRSILANDVTATASDGTTARAINQASIDDYGYARQTMELAASNDAAYQAAAFRVNNYGEPKPRVPALSVDLLPLSLALQTSMMAADIATRFTASNLPTQAPSTSLDFFIEGYTENIGRESYTFTFNVSPTTGFDVFTLDDAVKGVLDNTTYKLAY